MRYYKLQIDTITIFELNEKNPYAPRLRFNIQFINSELPTLSYIEIFNVDFAYFKNPKQFIGKEIKLFAGMKETKLNGLFGYKNKIPESLVYKAYINNVITNWNVGESTSVVFATGPKIKENSKKKPFLLNIKVGDNLVSKYKECIKYFYENPIIKDLTEIYTAINPIKVEINNLSELSAITKSIKLKNSKEYITINHDLSGFYFDLINAERYNTSGLINIEPYMLLEQPQFITDTKIQLSLILNSMFSQNKLITFSNNNIMNLSSILNSNTRQSDVPLSPKMIISGKYRIVSVWHIGDSVDMNPQAWATNIESTLNP